MNFPPRLAPSPGLRDRQEPAGPATPRSVTRDDVVLFYEKFLGRPPESEEAIAGHLQVGDFWQLVDSFLGSREFLNRYAPSASSSSFERALVPLGRVHNDVETEVSPKKLRDCLSRTKAAWTHLGRQKPHYSVLSSEKYLPEQLPANLDEFFQSGELEVDDFTVLLSRYLHQPLAGLDVSELGCGVGRVTVPLAGRFRNVHAYDISPPHLELARRLAAERGAGNIRFHEVQVDQIPEFAPTDVFYTRIVLQHNPPPIIRLLIRGMLQSLRPGGLALIHVPTYISGYGFKLDQWLPRALRDDMEMHAIPMKEVFEEVAQQGCAMREVREEFSPGMVEIISNIFVAQKL